MDEKDKDERTPPRQKKMETDDNEKDAQPGPSDSQPKPQRAAETRKMGMAAYLSKAQGGSGSPGFTGMAQAALITSGLKRWKKKSGPETQEKSPTKSSEEEGLDLGKMSFGGVTNLRMGLRKWKVKTQKVYNTLEAFAQDDEHHKLMQEHAHQTAIELPVPMKLAIVEDAMPVLHQIYKTYKSSLGKNDRLTIQAKTKYTDLTVRGIARDSNM